LNDEGGKQQGISVCLLFGITLPRIVAVEIIDSIKEVAREMQVIQRFKGKMS